MNASNNEVGKSEVYGCEASSIEFVSNWFRTYCLAICDVGTAIAAE